MPLFLVHDAQNGDAIIVSELSRLGRSMLEIMEILSIIDEISSLSISDAMAKTIATILLWREALRCQSPFTEYRESFFSEMIDKISIIKFRSFCMKTTAYLHISTIDQDIEKNKADILKLAHAGLQGRNISFYIGIRKVFAVVLWIIRSISVITSRYISAMLTFKPSILFPLGEPPA
jgi:hypothetical protein